MAGHSTQSVNSRVMQLVLQAAQGLGKDVFTANDIVEKVHESLPNLPATSIRTYLLTMSSNHSPTQRAYFDSLGDGKYKFISQETVVVPPPKVISVASPPRRLLPAEAPPPKAAPKQLPKEVERSLRKPEVPPPKPMLQPVPSVENAKEIFLERFGGLIMAWARENKDALIAGRRNYRWQHHSLAGSVDKRNYLSKLLVLSRISNNGGVDRQTLDAIMAWGFPNPLFPERDEQKCLEVTRETFGLLDSGKTSEAILKLMSLKGVGIVRASKIIGLFDQNYLAIFDSRVGTALKTLKWNGETIIKCPPGMNRANDADCLPSDWAENYQRLLWVLELIRNELNEEGYPFNMGDVEMALFTIGNSA